MWRLSREHCEQGKFCSQILNFHLFFFLKVMSGGKKKKKHFASSPTHLYFHNNLFPKENEKAEKCTASLFICILVPRCKTLQGTKGTI